MKRRQDYHRQRWGMRGLFHYIHHDHRTAGCGEGIRADALPRQVGPGRGSAEGRQRDVAGCRLPPLSPAQTVCGNLPCTSIKKSAPATPPTSPTGGGVKATRNSSSTARNSLLVRHQAEDYFGYAWGTWKPFTEAYHSQPFTNGGMFGIGSRLNNRFHIIDSVPFQDSFNAFLEKYHRDGYANWSLPVSSIWIRTAMIPTDLSP